jgi:hypothetical protein
MAAETQGCELLLTGSERRMLARMLEQWLEEGFTLDERWVSFAESLSAYLGEAASPHGEKVSR